MKKILLTAIALAALPASAPAAVTFSFAPGVGTPSAGFTVINTFADATGITGSGFLIKTPPADGDGAPPANRTFPGSSYLSVLGGGSAKITFSTPVTAFQFDWGSIDTYNSLTIDSTGADPVIVPGSNFINPANGDQVAPGTNGRFTVTGTAGELFNSVTFSSSSNSFEVDNLAIAAVPEPAVWGMMLVGFGAVGGTIRRRRAATQFVTA